MFIKNLTLKWIIMAKGLYKVLKKKRAKELLSKLLKDINILDIYIKKIEKRGIVGASIIFTI